ncbi:[4Fe-4S] proteins maturation [Linnemannia elongata]|nr:[4Fe-4S] proteins maturation [Linnemannia elongata]KAG0079526.1 [4Fe-4S] proteins maturation [Linnemannia elongata]
MASLLARTRIVSRLNTSVTKPLHNLACAATLSQSCSPAQRTLVTLSRTGFHKQALLAPTHTILRGSYHQRLNSTSAAAVPDPVADTTAPSTSTSELKIHNPQYDEAGKELTVIITDNAVKQLKRIAIREKNPLQALRITVDSGGCHGYQYLLDLTDTVNEDDVVFEKDGARVILDTITLPMVSGSRIDYIEELIGSAFKVLANPHAAHSCGCDTSFEIKI